jgi:fructuronate reductase
MKLRMLNGAHSMLAYSGFLSGHQYVRDVMGNADLVRLIKRHHATAAGTLDPVPGIDIARYAGELRERFANPAIAHETYQIAMDGTQKLPQRLLEPAMIALERDQPLDAYAFAVAAWMRYALGVKDSGETYRLRDPRESEIAERLADAPHAADIVVGRLLGLEGLFPEPLVTAPAWKDAIVKRLGAMLGKGMRAAVAEEAASCPA